MLFIGWVALALLVAGTVCSLAYLTVVHRLRNEGLAPHLFFGSVLGGFAAIITWSNREDLPHWLVLGGIGGLALMLVILARSVFHDITGE